MMEIKQVFLKTRAEFGKQCIFDVCGPQMDVEIRPDPDAMINYIVKTHCNFGMQHTKQYALHEIQTADVPMKSSGMFHFEGGWPKEINPKDEETTTRFRKRVEKDDEWAPKLSNLFQQMEYNVLQNGAVNIYENYFDDMIPIELVKPRDIRTLNVYEDPQKPTRSVNDISWSPDTGSKMVVSYCNFGIEPDYSKIAYIWQIDNPNKPWITLEAPSATVVNEFNPRDPSVLASGLMSGQVCSWDIRTGTTPIQTSHRQFSHRDYTTAVKWIATKNNTEFFSGSADGRVMWWDTRWLQRPTEILVFDLQTPNEPHADRAIGIVSADYEPSVGTKFLFGLENGIVISGSRKARTAAEKLAVRFDAHYGPVLSVDRSGFNPKIFLTVGDYTARIWAEDTKDSNLVSTRFIIEDPTRSCWNKVRHSTFYVTTRAGVLTVWDLLTSLQEPILSVKLCKQKLTAIAAHEMGTLLAVGNSTGNVYLVESTEALCSFDKNERNDLTSYLDVCSRFVKAIDARLREIKLAKIAIEQMSEIALRDLGKKVKRLTNNRVKRKVQEKPKNHREKPRLTSKKKLKEESPEIQEAEDRFFEIVNAEKQKYEEVDVDVPISVTKLRSVRKLVSRKIEEKEIDTEMLPEKLVTEIAEIAIPTTEVVEVEDVVAEEEETIAIELFEEKKVMMESLKEAILKSVMKEISKRKRRKKKPKKRLRRIFKLPRPCKIGICKPNICCRKIAFGQLKTSIRTADRTVKGREKWDEVDKETRSKDDVRARTLIERKNKMRRKKKESWTKLSRNHKREQRTRKSSKEKRIHFLEEMIVSSEKLVEDVKRAKREIREITRARTKTKKLAKRALKTCDTAMAAEKSRVTPRGSRKKERDLAKEVTSTTKRIYAPQKGRKLRRMAGMMDPCAPWEPPSLAKDLEALLRRFLPGKSIEK